MDAMGVLPGYGVDTMHDPIRTEFYVLVLDKHPRNTCSNHRFRTSWISSVLGCQDMVEEPSLSRSTFRNPGIRCMYLRWAVYLLSLNGRQNYDRASTNGIPYVSVDITVDLLCLCDL